ncbi:MAG: anti-sigma factor [Actinobacteria bacterium]|nr:anti-sigma factor [Actinomycetota bacterium]
MNTDNYNNESEIHLLAGPYALDSLDDIERGRFERHLETCQACQLETRELLATVARLAEAEAATPPPALRDAVMAQVAVTPQVVPRSPIVPASAPRKSRRVTRWLAAAAAVMAIGTVGAGTFAYQERQNTETLTAQSQMIADLVASPDTIIRSMPMGDATSSIVMSPSQGQAMMIAQGVPALPAGQTYELWTLTADGDARPAGVWAPGPNGTAAVPLEGDLSQTSAVAVTIEPTGGSATPSGAPIAKVVMA